MTPRLPAVIRQWPISVKVAAALTLTLLPLGIFTSLLTAGALQAVLVSGTQNVSLRGWVGVGLPLLMWLVALVMGLVIANRLLVGPLNRMRQTVERYTAGDTSARLGEVGFFSLEMTALAHAFDGMANEIGRHDAALNAALDEQKRLTREVHHRVKNNLQIVSSLLSIQAREASSDEVARAYSTIQTRVGALALVHRWLFDDGTGGQGVDLHGLATELCASLAHSITTVERLPAEVRCEVERIHVAEDTAVPIAFLVTELVMLAARAAAPGRLDAVVAARLDGGDHGGRATLTVTAPSLCDDGVTGRSDPAARIIQGIARQLRSPVGFEASACRYSIGFPVVTD